MWIFRSFVVWVFLSGAVFAQGDVKIDIQNVISGQIEAFQEDDFVKAFSYAAPSIKSYFGSSERFGQMVQSGYPMVWRPSQVTYLDLTEYRGIPVQRVLVADQDGALFVLNYLMQASPDGWQIGGVSLEDQPGA
jgi:hypothetical protein